jgi:hypothetical protein
MYEAEACRLTKDHPERARGRCFTAFTTIISLLALMTLSLEGRSDVADPHHHINDIVASTFPSSRSVSQNGLFTMSARYDHHISKTSGHVLNA